MSEATGTVVETQIDAVTVYLDRARVRRRGRVRLAAGQHRLLVQDLPVNLVTESVRAAARVAVPSRLLGTDVSRTFHAAAVEAKPAELQAEIERLQDQDEALKRQIEALLSRRTFLQTLAGSLGPELARGIALGRATVEAGAAASTFLGEQFGAVDDALQGLEIRRRQIGKELDAARSRLQNLQRRSPTERMEVAVHVSVDAEAELELDLTYVVTGAYWSPVYDLRLSERQGPRLSLTYMAEVTQTTGEPWRGVALSLSTAKPALSLQIPELSHWFIGVPVYPQAPARARAMAVREAAAPPAAAATAATASFAEDLEEALPMMESVPEEAEIEETGASVTFSVSGGTDIPDDGSPHKVTLGDYDLPLQLDYVTAPKLVAQAYRRAKVTNASPAILLPGKAQIFEEEEYVGSTQIKNTAPGQEWDLFLGVDDRIRVERKLTEGTVDKKLLVDVRRMTYAYEIKVKNLKSGPEKVTVLDQLPVSRHELVKVRRGDVKPQPARETEMGEARWELQLAPGQEAVIRFGFTIEAPRDLHLTGLPPLREA